MAARDENGGVHLSDRKFIEISKIKIKNKKALVDKKKIKSNGFACALQKRLLVKKTVRKLRDAESLAATDSPITSTPGIAATFDDAAFRISPKKTRRQRLGDVKFVKIGLVPRMTPLPRMTPMPKMTTVLKMTPVTVVTRIKPKIPKEAKVPVTPPSTRLVPIATKESRPTQLPILKTTPTENATFESNLIKSSSSSSSSSSIASQYPSSTFFSLSVAQAFLNNISSPQSGPSSSGQNCISPIIAKPQDSTRLSRKDPTDRNLAKRATRLIDASEKTRPAINSPRSDVATEGKRKRKFFADSEKGQRHEVDLHAEKCDVEFKNNDNEEEANRDRLRRSKRLRLGSTSSRETEVQGNESSHEGIETGSIRPRKDGMKLDEKEKEKNKEKKKNDKNHNESRPIRATRSQSKISSH